MPKYLSIYLSIHPSIYLSIHRSIDLSIYRSIDLSTYLPIYLSTYLPTYLPIYLSICLSIYLSIYLSNIYIYIYICVYIRKGNLIRKLPSYGRWSQLASTPSCQPHHHINNVAFGVAEVGSLLPQLRASIWESRWQKTGVARSRPIVSGVWTLIDLVRRSCYAGLQPAVETRMGTAAHSKAASDAATFLARSIAAGGC